MFTFVARPKFVSRRDRSDPQMRLRVYSGSFESAGHHIVPQRFREGVLVIRDSEASTAGSGIGHATKRDLCAGLDKDTDALYLLAFLLTANHSMAEELFVSATDTVFKASSVRGNWMRHWLKYTFMKTAATVFRESCDEKRNPDRWFETNPAEAGAIINAITRLGTLERFAYVMSVLEGYSVRECSILLGCSDKQVVEARTRAIQSIGSANLLSTNADLAGGLEVYLV